MADKKTTDELVQWFKKQITIETDLKEKDIDLDKDIQSYNLDSLSTVSISHELEGYLEIPIDPTIFGEFSTINEIIKWIQETKN